MTRGPWSSDCLSDSDCDFSTVESWDLERIIKINLLLYSCMLICPLVERSGNGKLDKLRETSEILGNIC